MEKIKVGISKCLLGEKVRYDGQHKHDRYITGTLGKFFEWVGYCPEADSGMSIPRPAMRLIGSVEDHRLYSINDGEDKTDMILSWNDAIIPSIKSENLSGYIFKAKSPSSGMADIKIYTQKGTIAGKGRGLFAERFLKEFPLIPVIDEGRLHDVGLRENFIEHVFVYSRWQKMNIAEVTVAELQLFHQRHKYTIMSHSPAILKKMGALVANADLSSLEDDCKEYLELLTEAMRELTTIKKHRNVLEHIVGYFKADLEADEKVELGEVIKKYYAGIVPLIVPLTLLEHYVRKYDKEYLQGQYYISPAPDELMMRSYV